MSQRGNVELLDRLTGLTHDIFVGDVKDLVRRSSVTSMLMQNAPPGMFKFSGQKARFAVDLQFKTGALPTGGSIPDYVPMDAVQGQLTATRRYARFALDNFIELVASGEGSFEDIAERITRTLWSAWESMEKWDNISASSGIIALCAARIDGDTIKIKDGYGHPGTDAVMHLSEGSMIGWWDIDEDQIGGAAIIESIDYEPDSNGHYEIELSSATLWEKSGKNIAEDDPIFFVTTPDIAAHHFDYSYNKSANGIGTIVDPDGNYTTVFGISETEYPRWAPFRRQSVTFDHLEVTSFWLRLGAKRGFDVTPATDISITHPAVVEQLARGLMAFQQQAYTGGQLQGGYPTDNSSGNTEGVAPAAALVIGGKPIYADGFFYHDVFVTIPKDDLYRVEVGGEADYWQGDGSRWSRMADYDGKDGFVAHYMNNVHCNRGGIGALTGITVDVNYLDYSPGVPNHV